MNTTTPYPIGTPGVAWGDEEKRAWLAAQSVRRSYAEQVWQKIDALKTSFDIEKYGALSIDPARYPLFALRSKQWRDDRPCVLVTGGVHGYETSGVQGALRFAATAAPRWAEFFNFLIAPCVSPWGYETINRWNPIALDPNRSFYADTPAEEAAALMALLARQTQDFVMHTDLHETTDTDNSEFRPALSARNGIEQKNWHIPDGFYTVGDTRKPTPEFQNAIIASVEQVTHIAPADPDGSIIGEVMEDHGVISYAAAELGLCMGATDAAFVTTTEVYPDSPKVDDENCIVAQVAAVEGALAYVRDSAKGNRT
ncbi:MAG: M14 family metallocarboxypeptidase [Gammaproteobacteria bacterium]